MNRFHVEFCNCPPLICEIHDTDLGNKYFSLLKQQYQTNPRPLFRDQQKYTLEHFKSLAQKANQLLGWSWHRDRYDLEVTVQLHKDLEQYLSRGYQNIPAEYDDLLHEIHFALHAIESGSRRGCWLQIEWYDDQGFEITADQYPAKIHLEFGDLRLQNPYVGHHPLFVYQQRDTINIAQTCKFHNFVKPGINLVIEKPKAKGDFGFNQQAYLNWFRKHGSEFLQIHGEENLIKFTGHPVIGRVLNLNDLDTVANTPVLEFQQLVFET